MRSASPGARPAAAALAALVYLALALWSVRQVLPEPASLLLGPPRSSPTATLSRTDQKMVLAVVARNARLLSSAPWLLSGEGLCHPTPRAYTLGEHMLGNGLLAAIPYRIGGDPILAYNALLVLVRLIAALSMYALSMHFTRRPGAAFVAGVLFAFHPMRLGDTVHPYVTGDLWTPLALLFLHRLFATGRWRDALGFAAFFSLGIAESLYALLSSVVLIGTLGVRLCLVGPLGLRDLAAKLTVAAAGIVSVAWLVFAPYLETAATWDVLSRAGSSFAMPTEFAPGNAYFPGVVPALLAAIALLDRLHGARGRGDDPRVGFLFAGLLLVWCASYGLQLPFPDVVLPSPLRSLRDLVPGLEAVRVLSAVRVGVYLVTAFLAGYGVLALLERAPGILRVALPAALAGLALAETELSLLAERSFGRWLEREAHRFAPDAGERALFERAAAGAVLDLPYGGGNLAASAHYLLVSAYHGRPTAACYNSFGTPVQRRLEALTAALPAVPALDALAALGFRTIAVHRRLLSPSRAARLEAGLAADAPARRRRTHMIGEANGVALYRLEPPRSVRTDFASLAPPQRKPRWRRAVPEGEPPRVRLRFAIANRRWRTFRHPDPIAPSVLVVGWSNPRTGARAETRARSLLPLALGARAVTSLEVEAPAPDLPPGLYEVRLARELQPAHTLGRTRVRLVAARASRSAPAGAPSAATPRPSPSARPAVRRASPPARSSRSGGSRRARCRRRR